MIPTYPERVPIAHLPTAIDHLDRLSQHLGGPKILMKRDDQTGLAMGGNKTRKLEFLIAEALQQGCDTLITTGGPQSNHCRQTAAAAARVGLDCVLVLRGKHPENASGNLLLNELVGARMAWTRGRPVEIVMREVADDLTAAGKKPYTIPLGGSNVVGASAYVQAMGEAMDQLKSIQEKVDYVVVASSSGGTQAGLVLGAHVYGYDGRILGISIDQPADDLWAQVVALATATAAHLKLKALPLANTVEVNDEHIGPGYGILTKGEREAIALVARLEGIVLDPVYTGRAMHGLIKLIRLGAIKTGERVLFWHTGGTPAIFAYGEDLFES